MKSLTKRQQEVFNLIKNKIDETGFPPTRAEIAKELGFKSANAAEEHIKALSKKGVIELVSGVSRGIKITEIEANQIDSLPLIGKVAAGHPILAIENIEKKYEISPNIFSPRANYLLRVEGMSMKNVGIYEGDLIAIHKTTEIRNGQIVVARIEDEVTVKRFEKKNDFVYLYPENEDFQVIKVDCSTENFYIEGVAVGILRDNFF